MFLGYAVYRVFSQLCVVADDSNHTLLQVHLDAFLIVHVVKWGSPIQSNIEHHQSLVDFCRPILKTQGQ